MKHIVIVTGASSGMGREFALQLDKDRQPEEIWLVARRKDRLEALATFLRPGVARIFDVDLASQAGIETISQALILEAKAGAMTVDTLVNNAGFGTYGPFTETDNAWQLSMIDVNVRGLTSLAHVVLNYMQKGSRIINVASLAAFYPLGNFVVYAATKAYVLSFTHALEAELRPRGVEVIALCPGPVDTEFSKVASQGAREIVLHGKPADKVVAHCLRSLRHHRAMAIYGLDWKIQSLFARLLNRRFVARLSARFMSRPSAKK